MCPTCLQVGGVCYCLWELAHGAGGLANEGWVLRVIFVDEEHGEGVGSRVDREEILLDVSKNQMRND